MFGECHAHMIMDGMNYKNAVSLHQLEVNDSIIHNHFQAYRKQNISFVRDGGDSYGVSRRAKKIAPSYDIDYRSPIFAIHKKGHYGGIVGHSFETLSEYHSLVKKSASQGADFIKIMTTGILDFQEYGKITSEDLTQEEVKEMVHIAHEEGFAVMSHTNGIKAAEIAILSGVDSLEHGNYIDQKTIDLLAESKTVWVPTISTIYNLLGSGRFEDSVIQAILHITYENIHYAYSKHATLALGSDAGAYRVCHGQGLLDEYALFHKILGPDPEIDSWLLNGEHAIRNRFSRQ